MRGGSNERLTILSDAEKTALYGIPSFDDFQRIEFFAMTDAERSLALQRRGKLGSIVLNAKEPEPVTTSSITTSVANTHSTSMRTTSSDRGEMRAGEII